jgi:hypothetical protein
MKKNQILLMTVVILYRYDVLLWKDILLINTINLEDTIYNNGSGNNDFIS